MTTTPTHSDSDDDDPFAPPEGTDLSGGQAVNPILAGGIALVLVVLIASGISAWRHPPVVAGPPHDVGGGITEQDVRIDSPGNRREMQIYLPASAAGGKVPCIFIAPENHVGAYAGADVRFLDNDRVLIYARAGFACVGYSTDGPVESGDPVGTRVAGMQAFQAAHFGVDNEKATVDYVLANVPAVDPSRLYVAGSGTAATVALLAAASDPRIGGCLAYGPQCDLARTIDPSDDLSQEDPSFPRIIADASPINHAATLHCPVFLLGADSSAANSPDIAVFARQLTRTNRLVTCPPGQTAVADMSGAEDRSGIAWLKPYAHLE